jgi:hypothetical protein
MDSLTNEEKTKANIKEIEEAQEYGLLRMGEELADNVIMSPRKNDAFLFPKKKKDTSDDDVIKDGEPMFISKIGSKR